MEQDNQYFAAKDAKETATILSGKNEEWTNSLTANGLQEKWKSAYCCYLGAYYSDAGSGHQITFGGEQGELVNFAVNNYRNIAQHIIVMTTSNRPKLDARATNTDYKSLVQASLANNILDYYMREKRLENYLKKAVEYAVTFGSGFIKMEWNATKGELVDYIEETKTKIYEGDIGFENLSPFDVMFDGTKENNDHDWVLIRTWRNKYDLAAKYPELEDKIIKLATKSDTNKYRLGINTLMETTDDVAVLEFYHKRTDCMPDGRYMMFCNDEIILQDVAMPYRVLPVFRIAAGDLLGTPHGYTPMFDLMPHQEALNSLYSTVLTNQNAFGVQNILNPRGNDIAVNQLQGGLNVVDYNPTVGKPEALNLTSTPKEVFDFIQMIERSMETLSGVNSVARGNPEASLKSGTALALVQSMALQFMSGLQQSYVELIEDVGSGIIKMLQDFAHTPRIIAISGKYNRSMMKEFSGSDISSISRVVVDVGNAMSNTTAGRVQMAQELNQYNVITPKQYINILHTGNLDDLTEQMEHENLLMRAENEAILDGQIPQAIMFENHKEHIDYHKAILFDPELKKDAQLVDRVTEHVQQHLDLLRNTDPNLLMILGQQPLPPPPPPGAPAGGPPPGPNGAPGAPQGGPMPPMPSTPMNKMMMPPAQGLAGPNVQGNRLQGPGLQRSEKLPNIARVPSGALPNPTLQAGSLGNVKNK